MSVSRPIIAVFGATGLQGGTVFRALVHSNEFIVRAITRTPQSDAAKKLLKFSADVPAGVVEVVQGDLDDEKSLANAFNGVWGAFVMTNFWASARDEQQAKTAADQALKAGVKFFVFSSMPDAEGISGGRRLVRHFSFKHRAEKYIRTLAFAEGASFPYPGAFLPNFLNEHTKPRPNVKDGVYEFFSTVRADVAIPYVDLEEEFANTVVEIFRQPKKYNQKVVQTGTYLTYPQVAEAFTKATGKAARYVRLPDEVGKNFGPDVYEMMNYFNEFGYNGGLSFQNIAKPTETVQFFQRHANQF